MNSDLNRRDFVRLAAGASGALALGHTALGAAALPVPPGRARIEPFDYRGVRLLGSRWRDQYRQSRDYFCSVLDDDILKGYRTAAGIPAPGQTLGGWCAKNSDTVFGQWLSGFARMYCATGDRAMRDKAAFLLSEWAATLGASANPRMGLYAYDKLLCGLVDLQVYAGVREAGPILERTLGWVMANYSPERTPATAGQINGHPQEWYTFGENLYRAYELTGNESYRRYADSYRYPTFWGEFAANDAPAHAYHVHAYSHVNCLSSAAMAYEVNGEAEYLRIIRHAHDYLQHTQCYATGGYGPTERWVPPDGTLGRSLEARTASFETVCGSWAGFKLTRYLQRFTAEARFGDWMERLLYNAVGAALPITTGGKHFYYSDYRATGGIKVYKVARYACCSGSLAQCVADYHNLIYYQDAEALYVNLYLPSEVVWEGPAGEVRVEQRTQYPEAETSTLRLALGRPARFPLKFRVPEWAEGASVRVNGAAFPCACRPGTWGIVERPWSSGDQLEIRIPLRLRMLPVDAWHPRRVAVVRGPVVLAMDDWVFEDIPRLPEPGEVDRWLVPDDEHPGVFRIAPPNGRKVQARFRPFYAFAEDVPYRIYHDLDSLPIPMP